MPACEFKDFMPDEFVDLYADAMLRRIMELAPYESSSVVQIEHSDRDYSVKIELHSATCKFETQVHSPDCRQAIDQAERSIYNQLNEWRKHRFDETDPTDQKRVA